MISYVISLHFWNISLVATGWRTVCGGQGVEQQKLKIIRPRVKEAQVDRRNCQVFHYEDERERTGYTVFPDLIKGIG